MFIFSQAVSKFVANFFVTFRKIVIKINEAFSCVVLRIFLEKLSDFIILEIIVQPIIVRRNKCFC